MKYETIRRIIEIAQGLTVIAGVIFGGVGLYFTYLTLEGTQKIESAKFAREIERDINSKKYDKIFDAIEGCGDKPVAKNTAKILKNFTSHKIADYIGNYEEIGILYDQGLITEDLAYREFSYDTEKTWCNKDIHQYVLNARTTMHDDEVYGEFQDLAELFLTEDKYYKANDYDGSCAPLDNK